MRKAHSVWPWQAAITAKRECRMRWCALARAWLTGWSLLLSLPTLALPLSLALQSDLWDSNPALGSGDKASPYTSPGGITYTATGTSGYKDFLWEQGSGALLAGEYNFSETWVTSVSFSKGANASEAFFLKNLKVYAAPRISGAYVCVKVLDDTGTVLPERLWSENGSTDITPTTSNCPTGYQDAPSDTFRIQPNTWISSVEILNTVDNSLFLEIMRVEVAEPAISDTSYDAATGILRLTGTDFVGLATDPGALKIKNSYVVDPNYIEGGANNSVTSANENGELIVTMGASTQREINALLFADGLTSDALTVDVNWLLGATGLAAPNDDTIDVTVSNVIDTPTLQSASYNRNNGVLTVSGTGFANWEPNGADIDVDQLSLCLADQCVPLASQGDVETLSTTAFSVTLTGDVLSSVAGIFEYNGTGNACIDPEDSTYQLQAQSGWAIGTVNEAAQTEVTVTVEGGTPLPPQLPFDAEYKISRGNESLGDEVWTVDLSYNDPSDSYEVCNWYFWVDSPRNTKILQEAYSPPQASGTFTLSVPGMQNGVRGRQTVAAINAYGFAFGGDLGKKSYTYVPTGKPHPPSDLSARTTSSTATLRFTQNNGGYAVTNYEISFDDGNSFSAFSPEKTSSPILLTELESSSRYSISLRAINSAGTGEAATLSFSTLSETPARVLILGDNYGPAPQIRSEIVTTLASSGHEVAEIGTQDWSGMNPQPEGHDLVILMDGEYDVGSGAGLDDEAQPYTALRNYVESGGTFLTMAPTTIGRANNSLPNFDPALQPFNIDGFVAAPTWATGGGDNLYQVAAEGLGEHPYLIGLPAYPTTWQSVANDVVVCGDVTAGSATAVPLIVRKVSSLKDCDGTYPFQAGLAIDTLGSGEIIYFNTDLQRLAMSSTNIQSGGLSATAQQLKILGNIASAAGDRASRSPALPSNGSLYAVTGGTGGGAYPASQAERLYSVTATSINEIEHIDPSNGLVGLAVNSEGDLFGLSGSNYGGEQRLIRRASDASAFVEVGPIEADWSGYFQDLAYDPKTNALYSCWWNANNTARTASLGINKLTLPSAPEADVTSPQITEIPVKYSSADQPCSITFDAQGIGYASYGESLVSFKLWNSTLSTPDYEVISNSQQRAFMALGTLPSGELIGSTYTEYSNSVSRVDTPIGELYAIDPSSGALTYLYSSGYNFHDFAALDADGDGITNDLDPVPYDTDGDGIDDFVEAAPAITFGTPTSTADGFTLQVTNYDNAFVWSVTTSIGFVSISDSGLITVTGLTSGQSATVTVSTTRTGYDNGSAQIGGSAIADTDGDGIPDDEDPFSNAVTEKTADGVTLRTTPPSANSSCSIGDLSTDTVDTSAQGVAVSGSGVGVSFTLSGCDTTNLETLTIKIDLGAAPAEGSVAMKIDSDGNWSQIEGATIEVSVVTYMITDNDGVLDQDPDPGTMADPVTVAVPYSEPALPVPTLPALLLGLLSLLMGLFGYRRLAY